MLNADFREGNDPGDELTVTYRELLQRVCQFANILKAQGELPARWPRPLSDLTHKSCSLLFFVSRREEGRPCVHIHAHGGRTGGRHVGVRTHRSGPLHRGELQTPVKAVV